MTSTTLERAPLCLSSPLAGGELYAHSSRQTAMGNLWHTVTTSDTPFALALRDQVTQVDLEPDFASSEGVCVIEFVSSRSDALAVLQSARELCRL